MNKQDLQKQHERVLRDSAQVKEHFKMYKVGKTWLFAGLFTISLGAGIVMGDHPDVHAATTETDPETSQSTATQTNLQAKKVVIGDKAQSQDSAPEMKAAADTTQTTTEPETQNTATQKTAAQNTDAQFSTDVKTPATSDTQAQTATTNVQTTNLGDVTDESTIEQAKTAAARTYAQTGTPQQVTAISGVQGNSTTAADPVQAVSVTVEDASKTYDNQSDTPATINVKLSSNLTAPTGWFVTGNPDEYQVATNSGDLDLSQVNQNAGTYSISLSTDGLIRLNAVKANQDKNLVVTTADVTAGKLTIEKAPVATGSVAIENTSKLYDNDASTDPTSYKVKISNGLTAPTDWTANADGTYTVTIASGDIKANIDSQIAGSYLVTLTDAGLSKITAANQNYEITADRVTPGTFQIQNNTKITVGVVRIMTTDPAKDDPKTIYVNVSREEAVPSDWTQSYDNTAQDEVVYAVPISYFDTSKVDRTKVGNYEINLTTAALNSLNTLNPSAPLAAINIQTGEYIVMDGASDYTTRHLSNFGGGGGNIGSHVLNDGDGATLQIVIFGSTAEKDNDFTDIIIIPAGLAVADVTTNPTDATKILSYTKATDPVKTITDSATQALNDAGTPYTNLVVKQLNNYKGRQSFMLQLGTVDSSIGTDTKVPINVVVDPDVTNVTDGNWGDRVVQNDAAILYATDDNALTHGGNVIYADSAYPNVPEVANALGLTNAHTISQGYDNVNWAGTYTIRHVPVQDTYKLEDATGNKIADSVTTSGTVGDAYDPLSVVPDKITTTDGTEYILNQTTVPVEQTFKAATGKIDASTTVAAGTTYTATYKKVIDTTKAENQVKINDQSIAWGNPAPTSYTVTLPSNLKAPAGWIKTTGNTYNVDVNSRDFAGALDTAVGTYNVTLSKQGLTSLAAANPDYLFDNPITGAGKLTITADPVKVTVTDTAGNTLKTVPTIQIGSDTTTNGDDVTVAGIPVSQLNHITFNFDDDKTNDSHVKAVTISADKTTNQALGHGTFYDSTPDEDVAYTAEQSGAATPGEAVAKLISSYNFSSIISFDGTTPKITKEFTRNLGTLKGLTSIEVVYNQKASATVTYVDDDNGGSVVPNTGTTLSGFGGDVMSYTVTIPTNYVLADDTVTNPTNVTLTTDDSDNLTIHLKHKIISGTKTTNRVINYVIDNPSAESVPQTPATVTQQITWNTLTDKVTDETVATAKNNVPAVAIQPITGYKATIDGQPATEVPAFYAGAANVTDLKDTAVTVTYTPKTVTADVKVPSNMGDQTVTGVSGTVDNHVEVAVPDLPGYTKDKNTVPATVNPDGTITVDNPLTSGKVTYTPDPQSINVTFEDQDKNVLGTVKLTGVSDGTVDYTQAYQKQQDVINQGYTLKKGNSNGLANAPKNFDHDDKSTPNYVVVLSKINQVNVTVSLVPSDDAGNPIPNTTPKKVTGLPGTIVTVPNVPGYTTSTPTVTIPETRDDNFKVTYTPDPQKINVHFVDDKGADLGTTTLTGVSDGVVNYKPAFTAQQALLNQGYTLKKGNNNGLANATKTYDRDDNVTPTYEVVLTKINNVKASYTITPVLQNGDPVPNSTVKTAHDYPGTTVNVPTIQGYTPSTDTVTIPDDRTPGINVIYTPNDVKTNVDVPSNKGPQTVTNVTGKTGDHLTVTVPTIPGYTPDKTTVPATVNPDGSITVDGPSANPGDKNYVTYTANDQTIVVNFVDKTGEVIGTAVLTGRTDETIDRSPAIIAEQKLMNMGNYTPKGMLKGTQQGGLHNGLADLPATFTSKSQTVTVQLTKINNVKVTVNLVPVGPDGTTPILGANPTTVTNYPGTNVTVPTIQGYTPTNTQLTIPPKNGDVPVVYTPNTVTANVNVPSNKGSQLVPNVTGKTGDHVTVTVPNVPGYTPNKMTVPATVNPDGSITVDNPTSTGLVTYNPDQQKMVVTVGNKAYIITGASDSPITYDENAILPLIPAGYDLAGFNSGDFSKFLTDNHVVTTFDHDDNTDQTWTVPLVEKSDFETATTTRTIHFIGDDGKTLAPDQVQNVTYVRPVGAVTRTPLGLFSPMGLYAEYTAPTVPGYTIKAGTGYTVENGTGTVLANDPMITDLPKDAQEITVYYTPNAQSAQVKYVDDDNNGATVGKSKTLTGVTDGSAVWDTTDKPTGYDLADKQATSGSYTFTAESNQTVTIHLTHHVTHSQATTTRTIHYVVNDPEFTGTIPADTVQKIVWNVSTDKATGKMVATPQNLYEKVTVPTIQGYTADATSFGQVVFKVVTALPANEMETVHYTANTVKTNVDIPSNKGSQTVPNVTGKTGDHVTVTVPTIPGYTPDKTTVPATVNPDGTITVDGPSAKPGDKGYVKYTANPQTITVKFTDEKGTALGSTVLTGTTDGKVDNSDAVIEEQSIINMGYTPKDGLHNGLAGLPEIFTSHSQTFTVQLSKISDTDANLTLVPSDINGNPISNTTPTTVTGVPGKTVTVPSIPGYTPERATIAIPTPVPGKDNVTGGKVTTPDKRGVTQKITYTPNTVNTNVDVPSNKGPQTVPNVTGKTGDHVMVNVPTIPGYTPDKTTVPATVNPDGTITVDGPDGNPGDKNYVNYTADPQSVKVQFVDDKGADLGAVTISGHSDETVDYSGAFAKEQDLLNQGYTLSEGDNNGLVSATKAFTQYGKVPTYVVELSHVEGVELDKVPTDNVPYANQYTVNFVTPNGTIAGKVTVPANPGVDNTVDVTPDIPAGYVPTPGNDKIVVNIPKGSDPKTPITVNVTTPAGRDADPIETWTEGEVPTDNVPYANQYTVNFVTPNGDIVGKVTVPANPGVDNTVDVTPDIPTGYVPTPGNDKILVNIPKGSDPKTPIMVNVTTPAGKDADPIETWTEGEVPTDNVPYANQYTVNFVTPNGDVVGKVTVPANPEVDNTVDVTPDIPAGYVPTPGNGKILVNIPKGADPKTPITVNITTPAGKDADPIAVWTKDEVPTDNVPSAHQYTINFVTPNGDVVGTTTVVGNPGNQFDVSGNVPNGYVLNGTDGDVEVPNNQDPSKPITVSVTVPSNPSDNGGTTGVPNGSSTDNGTGTPTDGPDTTTDGSDNNTVPGGDETDNNPTTGGKTDNNVISTDNGQKTVGQPNSLGGANSNAGAAQSGLVQQSSQAAAAQSQLTSNSSDNNSGATVNKAGNLPQTNEQNTSVWALLGLGLMSMLSLLGFTKQKKREDDK